MKKTFLLLLGIILAATAGAQVWDGTASPWTAGSGTQSDPYLIETPAQLTHLSKQVKAGETYEGKYFKLTDNLDMGADKGLKFDPIGFFDEYVDQENGNQLVDASKYFLGVFDGNGKTIDNIHIYYVDPNPNNSVGGTGLFACISGNAEVKNLTVGAKSKVEGLDVTGTFVGAMKGGKLTNCVSYASMDISGGMGQAGIVGNVFGGEVSQCVNHGTIDAQMNIGGIAGYVDLDGKVTNCYNTGSIACKGMFAGGIVGYLPQGTVTGCYNVGKVSADAYYSGAVIGSYDDGVQVSDCFYLKMADAAFDETPGVTAKTADEMKSAEFIAQLDNGQDIWTADTKNINGGYPVLKWQNSEATSISGVTTAGESDIAVNGHYVSAKSDKPCHITVSTIDGKTVADSVVNGGSVYVPAEGLYIVTVYSGNSRQSHKIIVK